jgi:phosphotransferase system  glucose/maltose/N-acetylglucosamine-specific IIC component
MLDIINNFIASFRTIAEAAIVLLAIVFVGMTWVRTRSLAPTLGAVLVGAVVAYGVINIDTLQTKVEEDVTNEGEFTP